MFFFFIFSDRSIYFPQTLVGTLYINFFELYKTNLIQPLTSPFSILETSRLRTHSRHPDLLHSNAQVDNYVLTFRLVNRFICKESGPRTD